MSTASRIGSSWRGTVSWLLGYVVFVAVVAGWIATGIVVVPADSWGAQEAFGRLAELPLEPGFHWGWPLPFSRTRIHPVTRIRTTPVGYEGEWRGGSGDAFLWTRTHGVVEHPRLCGSTTEFVVVNAVVSHQIRPTAAGFREYCVSGNAPEKVLSLLCEECLSEVAGSLSLEQLLAGDRVVLSRRLGELIQRRSDESRLGLDIVHFGILNIHPPVEAAAAYLEVVNAHTDVEREHHDARVGGETELVRMAMMADSEVADARAAASVRMTEVTNDAQRLAALSSIHARSPEFIRLWQSATEYPPILRRRHLLLLDPALPDGLQFWLGDIRPGPTATSNVR